ncbi:cytidylyltransferase domain-containing protein [Treponema phagedenis]|uniref:cytidylyltransferase domain-containing protein n=1 Tax=Treponema phagedenis TaxID=162 RepID=UPI0001F642F8|nr:methyltransferase domain-containing protein [Treponema phagedenis]EFW38896.1 cytidylyltransferase [Treponema phagedenis F0421]TYT78763.1 methyltransferase domain-containing protein [Treponema phagedenis]
MKNLSTGVAVIVQARLHSTRLPEKALLDIYGKPLLAYTLAAMRRVPAERYILACSEDSVSAFESIAKEYGYICIGGSEEDVLSRFCKAIKMFQNTVNPIKTIIRATADNPFLFYEAAVASLKKFIALKEPDYFTFTGLPHGSGIEVLKAESLLSAEILSKDKYEREHVGPALYRHTDIFICIREAAPAQWYYPELRTTIDTKDDYERALLMKTYLQNTHTQEPAKASDIIAAFYYAERIIVFYPSIKYGQGSGHLRRVFNLFFELQKKYRCLIYLNQEKQSPQISQIIKSLPEESIITELPEKTRLIVLDNFRTSAEEMDSLKTFAPVLALDEGGDGREMADYVLDILPRLQTSEEINFAKLANKTDTSFIPLPKHRRILPLPKKSKRFYPVPDKTKLLVAFGGEDIKHHAEPVAKNLAAIGFEVSVILSDTQNENQNENIHILPPVTNLREQLFGWDLVITHFGFTAFESLAAGCAVLLVSPTEYHFLLAEQTGFSVINSPCPSTKEFSEKMKRGIQFPDSITKNTEEKSLSDKIQIIANGTRYPCPICGENTESKIVGRADNKTIAQCDQCDMLFLYFCTAEKKEYSEKYFFDEYKAQYGKTYLEDFEAIKKQGGRRIKEIDLLREAIFKNQKANLFETEKKILDIGCAYGPFLSAAQEAHWHVIGTDVSEDAVHYVTETLNIPAFSATFPILPQSFDFIMQGSFTTNQAKKVTIQIHERSFHAITMWFVIEHFQDLDTVLHKVSDLLLPGGIFAFSTPNFAGVTGRRFPLKFFSESPTDHFSLFDSRTVKKQLERYGFQVKKIISIGHHPERFFPQYNIKKNGFIWKLLLLISKLFKLGDSMEVYTMKRGELKDIV